jgi:hypothetical protein
LFLGHGQHRGDGDGGAGFLSDEADDLGEPIGDGFAVEDERGGELPVLGLQPRVEDGGKGLGIDATQEVTRRAGQLRWSFYARFSPRRGATHPGTRGNLRPKAHRVAALLKRCLLGTHQGTTSKEHLQFYLDEFVFRFNRRTSRSRGLLFLRLLQQAVARSSIPKQQLPAAS